MWVRRTNCVGMKHAGDCQCVHPSYFYRASSLTTTNGIAPSHPKCISFFQYMFAYWTSASWLLHSRNMRKSDNPYACTLCTYVSIHIHVDLYTSGLQYMDIDVIGTLLFITVPEDCSPLCHLGWSSWHCESVTWERSRAQHTWRGEWCVDHVWAANVFPSVPRMEILHVCASRPTLIYICTCTRMYTCVH